jgi:hypothetical protein
MVYDMRPATAKVKRKEGGINSHNLNLKRGYDSGEEVTAAGESSRPSSIPPMVKKNFKHAVETNNSSSTLQDYIRSHPEQA